MVESLRILILEDNPADAELVQFELEEAGFVFTSKVVMTEEDFIHEIQEYGPDIILSDYDLPKYNGALALAEASKTCPDTPFILVTGAVSEDRAIDILTQGAKDYVLKNRLRQRLVPAVRRALEEAEEHRARKQAEAELREAYRTLEAKVEERTCDLQESRERLSLALTSSGMGAFEWDVVQNRRYFDDYVFLLLGIKQENFSGTAEEFFQVMHPDDRNAVQDALHKAIERDNAYETEYRVIWPDGSVRYIAARGKVQRDHAGNPLRIIGVCREITGHKKAEMTLKVQAQQLENANRQLDVFRRFLEIAHRSQDLKPLLQEFADEIQKFTGCEAVGIRLLDKNGNIPYLAYRGFSHQFYEVESPLSLRTDRCMCINVVKGTTDPALPFYTEGGSFYMNGTTCFLATVSEEDKGQTRNVCNKTGYESVALIPIQVDSHILGLIHLADRRENMVPLDMVRTFEHVAAALGVGVQRALAAEELRANEAKFRSLFDHALDAVFMTVPDGQVTAANRAACEMFRMPEEELCRVGRAGLSDPDDPHFAAALAERTRTGKAHAELSFIRKDGTKFIGDASSVIVGGQGPESFVVVRDITERKQAEEIQRQNREATERLANELALMAEIGRVVGSTLNINAVYEQFASIAQKLITFDTLSVNLIDAAQNQFRIAYFSGDGLVGRSVGIDMPIIGTMTGYVMDRRKAMIFNTSTAEEMALLHPEITRSLSLHAGYHSSMLVPLFSNDVMIGVLHFRSKKQNVYGESDLRLAEQVGMQIAGAVANAQLFDDLRKTEKSLRESEETMRYIIKHDPNAIAVYDLDLHYIAVSDRYLQDYNVQERDVIGKHHYDVFPEMPQKWRDIHQRCLLGVIERNDDDCFERPDGSITYNRWECRPWYRADGNIGGIITYTEVTTERKRAEEEREKLQVQLLQSQKMESVGRLAGGVAHDFNNMLGVILGHTEMAMDQVDPAQLLYSDLQAIRKAAQHSTDLTRQLLAFARKQTISPKVLNLDETVEGMLKMLRRLIGEDIHLRYVSSRDLWPVKVDPSQIDQILANLCVNARDAIAGVGNVTIEAENIGVDDAYCTDQIGCVPGDYVLLAVSDDGCGMDKETLGKLFEPFFTTKELGKGTGLGLATVYGIVKQNQGFLNVYSEPGQGTTFKIYLPRYGGKAEKEQTERPQESVMRGQETILVVEDEPEILSMTKRMLEKQGYKVLTAGTPGEAIHLAEAHAGEIHMLMTDVVMPEMNGRDLAKSMLSLYPNIKRLFMSGYTANVIAHNGVLDYGVHFIQKPFSARDLATRVRETLDQS